MQPEVLAATRRALHGAAELLLAGPQFRSEGTIRLRVVPGGFSTVTGRDLRIEGDRLVSDDESVILSGRSLSAVATDVGVEVTLLDDVYPDGSGVSPHEVVEVEGDAARRVCAAFQAGQDALRVFAPGCTPVLWPEHFDLSIDVDEVNYGVSPGDDSVLEPYAYVGPWTPREGAFWNAPFGASLVLGDRPVVDELVDFFRTGERLAREPLIRGFSAPKPL